jgi:hypothetical protein
MVLVLKKRDKKLEEDSENKSALVGNVTLSMSFKMRLKWG